MKLPFDLFKKNKDEESEYLLALLLTDEKVSAVILQQTLGKLRIVGSNEEVLHTPLEILGLDELINIVDKTVSKAEEILPPDVESHKTVFGVKDDWVEPESKKIKKDYLSRLKKVCDSLDLTPVGFMVVTEAISNFLQDEEGAPLSAILAEIGKKSINLTLFRGGKIAERISGPIEENAAATVDTLLKHFATAVLPARIILYDSKDSEMLAQKFIGHQWSKSLPFLHVPQIVALPEGADARAVVFGAASQMGLEILGMDPLPPTAIKPDIAHVSHDDEKDNTDEAEEKTEEIDHKKIPARNALHSEAGGKEDEATEDKDLSLNVSDDNFGFVEDHDIAKVKPQKSFEMTQASSVQETHNEKEHFEKKSFADLEKKEDSNFREVPSRAYVADYESEDKEVEYNNREGFIPATMTYAQNFLAKIRIPKLSLLSSDGGNKKFILPAVIIVGLIILFVSLSFFYTNSVKASLVLTVKPKIVAQTEEVVFSSTSSSDFSENMIAAKTVEATINGELSADTTGKKDVGDKAKGTVTVYNNGSSTVKLESGSQIKSSNNLIFLLDKDVTVASASGDIFSGTKPGTVNAAVTAKDIGTDSNLPSGTKFTVGSNSNLAAKNDNAFSGGSKKQVQVVSKSDVDKLKAALPKSLEAKANEEITKKISGDQTIIPLILVLGIEDQKFDKAIDDEAKKVKLTANVKFGGQTYEKDELSDFAKARFKSKYSQDISFADNTISTTIKDPIENKNNDIEATLVISAGLLPDINKDEIIKNAQTKSLKETEQMLSGLPQVVSTEIVFSPNIPFLPNLFPKLPRQITVDVKPE